MMGRIGYEAHLAWAELTLGQHVSGLNVLVDFFMNAVCKRGFLLLTVGLPT